MPQQQSHTEIGGSGLKDEREMSLQELIEFREHVEKVIERMEEEHRQTKSDKLPQLLLKYDSDLKCLIDELADKSVEMSINSPMNESISSLNISHSIISSSGSSKSSTKSSASSRSKSSENNTV